MIYFRFLRFASRGRTAIAAADNPCSRDLTKSITGAMGHLYNAESKGLKPGIGHNGGPPLQSGTWLGSAGALVGRYVFGPLGALLSMTEPLNVGEATAISGPSEWHEHHIYPRQFQSYFSANGINIDNYVVDLPRNMHLSGIHANGAGYLPGGWNSEWRNFIEANPNATTTQIYQQGGSMMERYGINHLQIHKYRE